MDLDSPTSASPTNKDSRTVADNSPSRLTQSFAEKLLQQLNNARMLQSAANKPNAPGQDLATTILQNISGKVLPRSSK